MERNPFTPCEESPGYHAPFDAIDTAAAVGTVGHSEGPWGVDVALSSDNFNVRYITDAEGRLIAGVRDGGAVTLDTALANAARIKAAVNVCDGMDTAALERLGPGGVLALVEALRLVVDRADTAIKGTAEDDTARLAVQHSSGAIPAWLAAARALLAKLA
jgi:hypothetical protein